MNKWSKKNKYNYMDEVLYGNGVYRYAGLDNTNTNKNPFICYKGSNLSDWILITVNKKLIHKETFNANNKKQKLELSEFRINETVEYCIDNKKIIDINWRDGKILQFMIDDYKFNIIKIHKDLKITKKYFTAI